MDLKHETLHYNRAGPTSDELMLAAVKTEPRVHSPIPPQDTGGLVLAPATTSHGNGLFASIGSVTKRPRPDDWLASPSPGTIPQTAPPLTPSPGPNNMYSTVISNGYSSPMSSGSYDPYSPNGKIGKSNQIHLFQI